MKKLISTVLVWISAVVFPMPTIAGAFLENSNREQHNVFHAQGYSGNGGVLPISIALAPGTPNSDSIYRSMRNAINTLNRLDSGLNNMLPVNNKVTNGYDFESALIHELGHCLGLGHPNQRGGFDYSKSLPGNNKLFDFNPGEDLIEGSSDDLRGDDVNLLWFAIGENNPFILPEIIDATTITQDVSYLPKDHHFPSNANRGFSRLQGYGNTESVMNSILTRNYQRRKLVADDVMTLKLAQAGLDGVQGTSDDYHLRLRLLDTTDANIIISMDSTAFAQCQYTYLPLTSGHKVIYQARVKFSPDVNWLFNQRSNNLAPTIDSSDISRTILKRLPVNQSTANISLGNLNVSDPEGDVFSWQISSRSGADVQLQMTTAYSATVTYSAEYQFSGEDLITVQLTDSIGAYSRLGIRLDVLENGDIIPQQLILVQSDPPIALEQNLVAVVKGGGALGIGWMFIALLPGLFVLGLASRQNWH